MDIFTPQLVKNDFLIENILKPVFSYQSSEPGPYSQIMSIFALAITAVAAVLLIFNVVQKLLLTANSGTLKEVSSTTILRWLVGLVLLIPMPPSNFGLGTQGVIWLAGQGINLANTAYENWDLNNTLTNKDLSYSEDYNTQILNILKVATSSHLCVLSAQENVGIKANGDKANFSFGSKSIKRDQIHYYFGEINNKYAQDRNICGHLTISYPVDSQKKSTTGDKLINWADQSLVNSSELKNTLKQAHMTAINKIITVDAAAIAKNIRNKTPEELSSMIESALKSYNNTIKTAFNNLSIFDKETSDKMKENGIAAAGAWFFKVSLINQQVNKAVNNLPAISSLKTSEDHSKNCSWYNFLGSNCEASKKLEQYSTKISADQKVFEEKFSKSLNHLAANSTDKKIASVAAADKKSNAESDFLDLFKPISSVDFNRLNYIDQTTKSIGNPLVKIQSLGQDLATAVQAVILSLIAFSWTGIIAAVAVVVMPFLLGILIPALLLAFYVPLLPFITWTGALVGWVVMLALSIFGVPLWLLAHLIPDQNGLVGRTGQGYMLILELFLKPVLLFAGYLSALFLLNPVMLLLNSFFGFAAESIFDETSSFLYVLYLISIFSIYFVIVNQLLKLLLNLMTEIPDSLFSWLGTNLNKTLSSYGHQLDERASHSTGAVLAHSVAGVGQLSNGLTSLFKRAENNNKTEENNIKKQLDDSIVSMNNKEETKLEKDLNNSNFVNSSRLNKSELKQAKNAEKININSERQQTINNKILEDLNKNESELSAYKKRRIRRAIDKEIA